jgi:hypothetical protein
MAGEAANLNILACIWAHNGSRALIPSRTTHNSCSGCLDGLQLCKHAQDCCYPSIPTCAVSSSKLTPPGCFDWMMMGWLGTSSSTSSLVPDYDRGSAG